MGRASFDYLNSAWVCLPLPIVRDSGAAAAYSAKYVWPFQIRPVENQGPPRPFAKGQAFPYDARPGVPGINVRGTAARMGLNHRYVTPFGVVGYTYSTTSVTETTSTGVRIAAKGDGGPGVTASDKDASDVAAGTNVVGLVRGYQGDNSTDTEIGPWLATNTGTSTGANAPNAATPPRVAARAVAGTGDDVQGLGVNMFGTPGPMFDETGAHIVGREGTNQQGLALGAMTTIVLHEADLAISQSDVVMRKFKAPFAMRILKITYGCASSAAGNSLRMRNATKFQNICNGQSLTAKGSLTTEPDSAFMLEAGRDVDYGDELDLRGTTGGTGGFTGAYAVLTVVVKGSPYGGATADHDRLYGILSSNSLYAPDDDAIALEAADKKEWVGRNLSGPVIGAPIALYIGGMDSPATGTDDALQSIEAPFDMDVYMVAVTAQGTVNGNTLKVRNVTTGADVVAHMEAAADTTPSNDTNGNQTFLTEATKVRINRGDEIGVFSTTSGTANTLAGAIIFGVARGFPYDNAALD